MNTKTATGAPRPVPAADMGFHDLGNRDPIASISDVWWRFLAESSGILEASLDYETTLARVARLGVPAIADFCAVALGSEHGPITWAEAVHRDPAKAALAERLRAYPLGANREEDPVLRAFTSAVPQLIPVIDRNRLMQFAHDAEHRALMLDLAPVSLMAVPLIARGRLFGSLILAATADSGRHYSEADVVIAREVARRAALAVDHATMFRDAVRATHAREKVLAVVSHDLKNPLNVIVMSAELLEEIVPEDADHEEERARIRAILRAAASVERLVNDLLDATALDAGRLNMELAPIPAAAAMLESFHGLEPLAAAKQVLLGLDASPDLPAVRADVHRLTQVFGNVIGNAIKFTPPGGFVKASAARVGDAVEYRVSDTGRGIDPADLPHVFDHFWHAPAHAQGGHGLGLAIARAIVEAHGGRMDVHSRPGEGTTFSFRIPVATAPDVRETPLALE